MSCEYVREYYQVPAVIGRRVVVAGQPGIIAEDCGHYIGVNFDEDKPGVISNCHPTWKVEYQEMGQIRKSTRSQRRYREWLNSECGLSFSEWLGAGAETECETCRDGYRYFNRYRQIYGPFRPTKKAAKAQYKELLKSRAT